MYVQCLFISVWFVCVSTECWSAKVFQSLTANVIPTLLSPYWDLQGHISHTNGHDFTSQHTQRCLSWLTLDKHMILTFSAFLPP